MSRLVAGTLLLPDGTPMAGASIYFTAKRTEPDAIVKGIDAFFKTNSTGIYSQEIENGWYTVTIEYQLSGTYPRRWTLGEVVIEDGPATTLNALIIAMTPPDDPNLGIFQQLLLEAQAARDDAIDAANAAQQAAATITPAKQAQWDEAYSDRMKWDGGADGLNAAAGRTSLQLKSAALQESTAFATAAQGAAADAALAGLAQKINTTEKGSANGVATLDSGGVVPEAQLPDFIKSEQRGVANGVATLGPNALIPPEQLPSYVDDVLEFATYADLPVPGETGKIYIVKTAGNDGTDPFPANQQFRWSGTAYIKLVASPGTTDNVVEGAINLYFTAARAINSVLTDFVAATTDFVVSSTDTVKGALQKIQGRLNLLGTASNANNEDFATAAQGEAADNAVQLVSQRVALANTTSTQYINCSRLGDVVTISSESIITHAASTGFSNPGVIPEGFRPLFNTGTVVCCIAARTVRLIIGVNGDFSIDYFNWEGSAVTSMGSDVAVTISYVV